MLLLLEMAVMNFYFTFCFWWISCINRCNIFRFWGDSYLYNFFYYFIMEFYPGFFTDLIGFGVDEFLNINVVHNFPFYELEDWWQDTPRVDDTDYILLLHDDICDKKNLKIFSEVIFMDLSHLNLMI